MKKNNIVTYTAFLEKKMEIFQHVVNILVDFIYEMPSAGGSGPCVLYIGLALLQGKLSS